MPFDAKSAIPCDSDPLAEQPALDDAAEGGVTLLTAPAGYVLTEGLAAAFQRRRRPVAWTRLGPEDGDPGVFLASLITAARRVRAEAGTATLELMRAQPGPAAGWSQLFGRLGQELADTLPSHTALVVEGVSHANQTHPTLALFGQQVLPHLPRTTTCVLTSHEEVPRGSLPEWTVHRSAHDLRLGPASARAALERAAPGLDSACLERAVELGRGQAGVLSALCASAAALGPGTIRSAVDRAGSQSLLLALLAEAWLMVTDAEARGALAFAVHLGYSHPALSSAARVGGRPARGPWLQNLTDGCCRIRTLWRAPLLAALSPSGLALRDAIHRAADYLIERDAAELAIPLYLELGDTDCGTRAVVEEATHLLDLGQWETLGDWLDRLPQDEANTDPWLLYNRGELAAARGQTEVAERQFSLAASEFTVRHDLTGACQSMLASSAVAAGRGKPAEARALALAASANASAAGLVWHQLWASWQLGALASGAGELDDALAYFDQATGLVDHVDEPLATTLLSEAERLARSVQELRDEREAHRQAYAVLGEAEHEATERLLAHVSAPPDELRGFIGAYGWSHTPPVLKLTVPRRSTEPLAPPTGTGWWSRMRHTFTASRAAGQRREREAGPAGTAAAPVLAVHLLGVLRVTLNDVPLDDWPSGRGRSLFKYLLTHRDPWASREILMQTFWPDAAPDSARNSLNVAIHGLRRSLRAAADVPVVVLDGGVYRLHPDVRLWLDVEEFERHVASGRGLEEAGELTGAMAEYELATALYQGDFLADDPYEEWPVLTRERLRLAYLDTLDRISHLYFSHARYAACAELCQRIIERDLCREDAHRRLMRCYSRQGQPHLALRQYRACADALEAELGVEPAPATTALHERIRRHEPV